jgi:hypothetical protein
VDIDVYAASIVANDGFCMSGTVVEELGGGFGCGFGASCLSGRESAKGNEHGGVDCASVEQEGADAFMEAGESSSVSWSGAERSCLLELRVQSASRIRGYSRRAVSVVDVQAAGNETW